MTQPVSGKRARTLAIEFVIIVIGVFIAVAAESWWSEREDRLFEQDIREDMLAEFSRNIQILEADIDQNRGAIEHSSRLGRMSDDELMAQTDEFFETNYRPFPEWAGFDPDMGIVQALVKSGNLGAISEREFRLRLSRWGGLLTEQDRKMLQATSFQMNSLIPAIAVVSGDAEWDASERRQIQLMFQSLSTLQTLVFDTQLLLLEEARSIHAYLSGTD